MFDQLWVVASGRGKITTQSGTFSTSQGNHFIFRKGEVYDIEQDADHPLETLFAGYNIYGNSAQYYQTAPVQPATLKGHFSQHIITVMLDLYWDAYISYREQSNEELAKLLMPRMRIGALKEVECLLPPNPVIYQIETIHSDHPCIRSASIFFHSLLQEIVGFNEYGNNARHFTGANMCLQQSILDSARQIQNNPKPNNNIKEIAAECGYSADHYTRVYKKIIGCHPRDFIINVRINRARDWLKDSELSIKRIAFELGYPNSQHFSNQFKEHTGVTPSAFRKNPQ